MVKFLTFSITQRRAIGQKVEEGESGCEKNEKVLHAFGFEGGGTWDVEGKVIWKGKLNFIKS